MEQMSVRAEWFQGASVPETPFDPFGASYSAITMSSAPTALPIDLSTPEPKLRERLAELIRREGNLYDCGTSCSLKDAGEAESVCLACPYSMADVEDSDEMTIEEARQRVLCRIGREQQTISTVLTARRRQTTADVC